MNKSRIFFFSLLCSLSVNAFSQFYSARTNLLGLATGNLNVELGMTLNKKISLHLPVQYNPFIYSREKNTKFQNLTVMPGARYWLRESFMDQFIGVSLIGSRFNIGNIFDSYRYDGYGVGAGVSFGWTYPMASRWNFEWEIGVAGLWTSYDKSVCKSCGYSFGSFNRWYVVPHKISASLIYLF